LGWPVLSYAIGMIQVEGLLGFNVRPTALYADFHETTGGCCSNVMGCVECTSQAASSITSPWLARAFVAVH
jgi:hypothetical protein